MAQMTFSDIEYSNRKRKTKREQFLDMMDAIIPWNQWVNVIKPCEKIFADVTERLNAAGLIMHGGTIVDATIIASTPSTKK